MTRTGPRHEKPPSLRLLRPGRPYTLEKAPRTPEYTRLLESIWALLSYGHEPHWVYAASDWAYHIEHKAGVIIIADRWDHAIRQATKLNVSEMKVCEEHTTAKGPRVYPLVDCAVAWHLTAYYTLAPWVTQSRQTNIFDRDHTALSYVRALLPLLSEYPEQTTEMAERLAAHHGARIFR